MLKLKKSLASSGGGGGGGGGTRASVKTSEVKPPRPFSIDSVTLASDLQSAAGAGVDTANSQLDSGAGGGGGGGLEQLLRRPLLFNSESTDSLTMPTPPLRQQNRAAGQQDLSVAPGFR